MDKVFVDYSPTQGQVMTFWVPSANEIMPPPPSGGAIL
jgi:hypothetical protein